MGIVDPGYAFVPLPAEVLRRPRDEATHDRRLPGHYSGRIECELVCEQPVHTGSGFKNVEEDESNRFQVRRAASTSFGSPVIPGSGLKGVLRARYEAITHSCLLFEVPSDVQADARGYGPCRVETGETTDAALCPACSLFGTMSRRSRVTVEDARGNDLRLVVAKMPEQFGPRPEKLALGGQLRGRKFSRGRFRTEPPLDAKLMRVEVLPEGSTLVFGLRVLNLTEAELGGLLTSLGHTPASRLKVGGGKGVEGRIHDEGARKEIDTGFGRVRVTEVRLGLRGGVEPADPKRARAAFEGSDDRFEAGERALAEIHQGDC